MSINNKNKARVNLRDRMEIAEGNKTQEDAKFSPSIFGTVASASRVKHPANFHRPKDPRTESLFRVREYLNDPQNKKRTDNFIKYFNNPQFDVA